MGESYWISASAGTGKTERLVKRVVELLLTGESGIVCITFTRSAAIEIQLRIKAIATSFTMSPLAKTQVMISDFLKNESIKEFHIKNARSLILKTTDTSHLIVCTIHSYCFDMLLKFPEESSIHPMSQIIEDNKKDELLNQIINQELLLDCEQNDSLKAALITVPEMALTFEKHPLNIANNVKEVLARRKLKDYNENYSVIISYVISKYIRKKELHHYIDFDEILKKAGELLISEHRDVVIYENRLRHLLIDEAQDNSSLQWLIVEELCSDFFSGESVEHNNSIFVVGDIKQSIYSFQGAKYEMFNKMKLEFSRRIRNSNQDLKEIDLIHSYRSSKAVIDFVNIVFQKDTYNKAFDYSYKEHSTHSTSKGIVEIHPLITGMSKGQLKPQWTTEESKQETFTGAELASSIISKKVLEILQDTGSGDIIILTRKRSEFINSLTRKIRMMGVSVAGLGNDIHEDILIQDLINVGLFASFPHNDFYMMQVIKSVLFSFSDREIDKISSERDPSKSYLCPVYLNLTM